ncbi:hypothetical protein [Lysinibacillus sphaericus]|uniref:hypothetical protein n=1 Tax=Lysinibacillus sphaericus TaxID=1421 RepID=UPI001E2BC097|nr:hypothetical protein [Lysinibacillus sphaericus]
MKVRGLWLTTIKVLLELIRIVLIFLIFGCLLWGGVRLIYTTLRINVDGTYGGWLGGIAIYFLLFVLYRNKLQFSGFYDGPKQQKLPRKITCILLTGSIFLLILPLLLSIK